MKVLCVEDDPINRIVLGKFLKDKYEVQFAFGFNEALKLLEDELFDILILDYHLGESNTGLDILKASKKKTLNASTPALALTADPDLLDFLIVEGFQNALCKPCQRADLHDAILSCLGSEKPLV